MAGNATWGVDETLSPMETMFWRVEVDEALKSTIVSLEILEATPDWNDVVAAHEYAVDAVPRLRERVVDAALPAARPRWAVDPGFTLSRHLRRERLRRNASFADLFAAASQVAVEPFDRSGPPWEAILYTGLPGGRAAYLLKLHHSTTDGTGVVQLLGHIHDQPKGRPALALAREPGASVTPWGAVAQDVRERVVGAPSQLSEMVAGFTRVARRPVDHALSGLRYGNSLRRITTAALPAPSPLLAGRSTDWQLAGLECNLKDVKGAATASDGTINDVFLAALLGGYQRYHAASGHDVSAIPISIPVSTRTANDPDGGNLFVPAKIGAPLDVLDPAERVQAVGALVRAAREEPALDYLARLAPAIAKLPGAAIAQFAGAAARGNDLQASNVRGTSRPVYLGGKLVERLFPFAPLPGCPAMITMLSHLDTVCIGVNYDSASFVDGDLFLKCLVAGFDEVLALADHPAEPARRVV